MAEFATHAAQEESESHVGLYLRVFVGLLILTIVEYFYAKMFAGSMLVLVFGLLLVASVKAGMVGNYFMHVKWEGKWVFGVIIPACILAMILICGLLPDVANSPTKEPRIEEEASLPALLNPGRLS